MKIFLTSIFIGAAIVVSIGEKAAGYHACLLAGIGVIFGYLKLREMVEGDDE